MSERRVGAPWMLLSAALLGSACGSTDGGGSTNPAGGGSPSLAGASTEGIAGGASSSGGTSPLGGAVSSGGSAGSGGTSSNGGLPSTGGGDLGGAADGGKAGEAGHAATGDGGESSCGEVGNVGSSVRETQRSGEAPAPRGGTIAEGTYVLTARNVYPPAKADGAEHSATLHLAGDQFELVRSGGVHETGSFSATTIVLKLSATCPATAATSRPYTAVGTALSLFDVGENREEVFTRQ
jgi:hypothetical protein